MSYQDFRMLVCMYMDMAMLMPMSFATLFSDRLSNQGEQRCAA